MDWLLALGGLALFIALMKSSNSSSVVINPAGSPEVTGRTDSRTPEVIAGIVTTYLQAGHVPVRADFQSDYEWQVAQPLIEAARNNFGL